MLKKRKNHLCFFKNALKKEDKGNVKIQSCFPKNAASCYECELSKVAFSLLLNNWAKQNMKPVWVSVCNIHGKTKYSGQKSQNYASAKVLSSVLLAVCRSYKSSVLDELPEYSSK